MTAIEPAWEASCRRRLGSAKEVIRPDLFLGSYLARFVTGHPGGVLIADETAFIKKGIRSASGAARMAVAEILGTGR